MNLFTLLSMVLTSLATHTHSLEKEWSLTFAGMFEILKNKKLIIPCHNYDNHHFHIPTTKKLVTSLSRPGHCFLVNGHGSQD